MRKEGTLEELKGGNTSALEQEELAGNKEATRSSAAVKREREPSSVSRARNIFDTQAWQHVQSPQAKEIAAALPALPVLQRT